MSGIPDGGKSTVAVGLAARFARSAHIEVDELQELIVGGGRRPTTEHDPEADRQIFQAVTAVTAVLKATGVEAHARVA